MSKTGKKTWEKGGPSPNPKGRPRKDAKKPIAKYTEDGWASALTGLGTSRDRRTSTYYNTNIVLRNEAETLWRGNALGARVVELVPDEMVRQGWEPETGDDKETEEQIAQLWDDYDIQDKLATALMFERAYGGAAILLGVNDGAASLEEPLRDNVSSFSYMTVLEPRECIPLKWYSDPLSPKFSQPAVYQLNPSTIGAPVEGRTAQRTTLVHESRLLIFPGIKVSRNQKSEYTGWGDSIFTRLNPILRDFGVSWESAAILMEKLVQDVFKIQNLDQLIAADEGKAFKNRMQALDLAKSVLRSVVVDAEEDYQRVAASIAGAADILDRMANLLAAASGVPVTLLMGQSPAGLAATGDSDVRFWYDKIKSQQHRKLNKKIRKLTRLMLAANNTPEPETWKVKFLPLWQPTQKEVADTRKLIAETDHIYINDGVVSPEEVAFSRFGADEYSSEMVVDFEAREEFEPPQQNQPPTPPEEDDGPDSSEEE